MTTRKRELFAHAVVLAWLVVAVTAKALFASGGTAESHPAAMVAVAEAPAGASK